MAVSASRHRKGGPRTAPARTGLTPVNSSWVLTGRWAMLPPMAAPAAAVVTFRPALMVNT
jgi:hypothetical protein